MWHDLSNHDKFSQRLTANASVTDSAAADSADNHGVDIGQEEGRKFPRLRLMRLGTTSAFLSVFLPIVHCPATTQLLKVSSLWTFFFLVVSERVLKVLEFSIQRIEHFALNSTDRLPLWMLSLFQNERTEAVDTGGCDGTSGANSDGGWRRQSRKARWSLQSSEAKQIQFSGLDWLYAYTNKKQEHHVV